MVKDDFFNLRFKKIIFYLNIVDIVEWISPTKHHGLLPALILSRCILEHSNHLTRHSLMYFYLSILRTSFFYDVEVKCYVTTDFEMRDQHGLNSPRVETDRQIERSIFTSGHPPPLQRMPLRMGTKFRRFFRRFPHTHSHALDTKRK